jgi:hypothetical protein
VREFLEILAPLDETATGRDLARSLAGLGRIYFVRGTSPGRAATPKKPRHDELSWPAMKLLADLTSPHPQPSEHDAWCREADLVRQDSLPPRTGKARRRRTR